MISKEIKDFLICIHINNIVCEKENPLHILYIIKQEIGEQEFSKLQSNRGSLSKVSISKIAKILEVTPTEIEDTSNAQADIIRKFKRMISDNKEQLIYFITNMDTNSESLLLYRGQLDSYKKAELVLEDESAKEVQELINALYERYNSAYEAKKSLLLNSMTLDKLQYIKGEMQVFKGMKDVFQPLVSKKESMGN